MAERPIVQGLASRIGPEFRGRLLERIAELPTADALTGNGKDAT